MENKINYYLESMQIIEKIKDLQEKPTLLLHVCCGPCACHPVTFLSDYFKVSIIYNNSNIYPKEEHDKRLNEVKKLLANLKRDRNLDIPLIIPSYDNQNYNLDLAPFALEKEGGARCRICFKKRMEEGMKYAKENGFDYFATALSVSPYKNAQVLNAIGKELEAKYPEVHFFYSDFKKKNGALLGRAIADKYNLYEQDYCGCIYSYQERQKRNEEKE